MGASCKSEVGLMEPVTIAYVIFGTLWVMGAITGASLGDKFIDVGQLEKEKDIGKLPASEIMVCIVC